MSLAVLRGLLGSQRRVQGARPRRLLPEQAVGGGAAVSDVVEENLQLLIVVEVGCDDGADGGRHGELGGGDVLHGHSQTIGTGSRTLGSCFDASGPLLAVRWGSKEIQSEGSPAGRGGSVAEPPVQGAPGPHPESDAAGSSALQVEAVRPVPVAIDDVHSAVPVEVSQRHTASVLVGVIQPWGTARGQGETGTPP